MEWKRCGVHGWCVLALGAVTLAALLGLRSATAQSDQAVLSSSRGLASYYGPGFHGQKTASGEVFDQNDMVAAHRTLPLGSVVRVVNLENGRDIELRVIDRGPYGTNRRRGAIIDVSKGAAEELDFIEDGIVRVRVEVLELPEEEEDGAK